MAAEQGEERPQTDEVSERLTGRQHTIRLILVVVLMLVYGFLYPLGHEHLGGFIDALAVIPAAIAGGLLGVRGGFAAGLILVLLTAFIHSSSGCNAPSILLRSVPAQLAAIGIGVVAGWARNAVVHLRRQSALLSRERANLLQEVQERKKAEEALRETQDRFRALLDNLPDVIMRFDREGRHLYVNPVVEPQTGIAPPDFIGKTHRELGFPEHLVEYWEAKIQQTFAARCPQFEEFALPGPEGDIVLEWRLFPEFDARGEVATVITIARDITVRKKSQEVLRQAHEQLEQRVLERTAELARVNESLRVEITERAAFERELRRRLAMETLVAQVSAKFMGTRVEEVDDAIRDTLRRMGEAGYGERTYVVQYSAATDTLESYYEWCAPSIDPQTEDQRTLSAQQFPWWMAHLRSNRTIHVPSVADLPSDAAAEKAALSAQGTRSALVVPFWFAGQLRGYLGLHAVSAAQSWNDDDIRLLRLTGEIIASALHRKQTEYAVRRSELQYRTLIETSPDAIVLLDGGFAIRMVNPRGVAMAGVQNASDLIGKRAYQLIAERDHGLITGLRSDLRHKRIVKDVHLHLVRGDGGEFPAEVSAAYTGLGGKEAAGIIVIVRDVTQRNEAEAQIRQSLQEKEVLLKEVHHRVKNNMQVISSLLSLQGEQITDPAALTSFRDSQNRVRSMALVHEKLYRSESLASIDFSEYVADLMASLKRSYIMSDIDLRVEADDLRLGVDMAIPCGLIINELVSNALKHAFKGRKGGMVDVRINRNGKGKTMIRVQDDGNGLPSDFDHRQSNSLGMQLVSMLTEQLGGSLEVNGAVGTCFTITFPTNGQ
jgi:PAS domain S-box-containing protein